MRKKGTDGLPHVWVPIGLADRLNSRYEGMAWRIPSNCAEYGATLGDVDTGGRESLADPKI